MTIERTSDGEAGRSATATAVGTGGLSIEGLVKRFGNQTVVAGATLRIAPGEIVALLGPSGCGKTTTLRLVAGFEKPDAGKIALAGEDLAGAPPFRRRIGLVFQDYALFPHMTVAANIDYGMRMHGVPAPERDARREKLLGLVRLDGLDARRPAQLSGGQQQRVALARALAISPRLLLLDEPLSNLDAKLRETLRTELKEILRAVGMTTLIVTHDQLEAIGLADRIAVMRAGRIEQVGTPREIYEQPANRFVAEFIGQSIWFTGEVLPTSSDGPARFRTSEGYELVVPAPPRKSERQGLLLRPEQVHLDSENLGTNRIPARVKAVEFFGAETLVQCLLEPSGRLLAIPVRTGATPLPTPGDLVHLGLADEAGAVISDDEPTP